MGAGSHARRKQEAGAGGAGRSDGASGAHISPKASTRDGRGRLNKVGLGQWNQRGLLESLE